MNENNTNQETTNTPAPGGETAGTVAPPAGETLLGGQTPADGQETGTILGDGATGGETGQTEEDAPKPPAGAPEKYEFTTPEGMTLDSGLVEQFTPIAKELNLTNEQAQKLVDLYGAQVLATSKANTDRWENIVSGWAESSKNDQEFGGKSLETSISHANKALKAVGTPALEAILKPPSSENPTGMGLGNHPEIIRLLARVGKTMGEDTTHMQGNQAPAAVSMAKAMFPDMN